MFKVNYNDLVHILKQIKIAENHTATGQLVDALGNPLNALAPYGLRTVSGEYNNLVNLTAGSADQLLPRSTTPVWNAAEVNPRTQAPTSYTQTSGSVYDSQPRIISNLVSDQSMTNPVAVMAVLSNAGITSGALYNSVMSATEAAHVAINAALAAGKELAVATAGVTAAQTAAATALSARDSAQASLTAAQAAYEAAQSPASGAEFDALALAQSTFTAAQEAFDAAQLTLTDAQGLEAAARLQVTDMTAVRDAAIVTATEQLALAGVEVQNGNLVIPNVMADMGATAPFNGFMTLFGQFFDHGLDLIPKGGNGTVFVPLQPDDPLYVPGSPTNFMVMSRATNQPGPDGILGTADDIRETANATTPWIDLNQVYTSHESHQVFLREYTLVDGKPQATGKMLEGIAGGPPTWADIKAQALNILGIQLSDTDVHRVPLLATDLYGNFIPGANGLPQIVVADGAGTALVEGSIASPVLATQAIASGHAFLHDIAHTADPKAGLAADADTDTGNALTTPGTYDNELLDRHFIVGDGRGNENIGLTAIHTMFHSEHNHRIDQVKAEIIASGDLAFINEWLDTPVTEVPTDAASLDWNGERLFQAGRFSTEQVYQHLVFEEFVRTISPNIDLFVFSNTVDVDPAITAEFAHVVYRFGHSMLNETVDRLDINGQPLAPEQMGLIEAFLNPVAFDETAAGANGPDAYAAAGAIIRGMSRQVGNEIDEFVTGALRNNLVGLPLDLGTLNIARGRDTGVPSLNAARADFFAQTGDTALKPYESWFDFALNIKNPASIINFIAAYGQHSSILEAGTVEDKRAAAMNLVLGGAGEPEDRMDFLNSTGAWAGVETGLNMVDFWIGGLAEKKMPFGGMLGSTFTFVFEVQMEKLQDGDRFYYLSRSQGMNLLNQLEADSFANLAMRTTDLGSEASTHLPNTLMLTPDYILEMDQARQNNAGLGSVDPTGDNPILSAMSPLVIRKDTNGDGVNDYLRFTGDQHVVLGGTSAADTLIGGAGDDALWGGAGNDFLEGGLGIDHITAGEGDDIITDIGAAVGAGDVSKGEGGNDAIFLGEGLDLAFGGEGQDFIVGARDTKDIFGGEGSDFVYSGDGASVILGNEGNDWLEGGDGFDILAGENSELFFNSPIIGHDVMNGRGNDTDYDAESGDDIMFEGVGVQRSNGMAGFDWVINKDNPVAANSDLGIPIFVNQQDFILRDRYDLVEGLSGWKLNDTLTGRDVVPGARGAGAAAIVAPDTPFLSVSNVLTQEGVDRIAGFNALVNHLDRETVTWQGREQHTVVVFDQADVVRDGNGVATDMIGGAHDILLGGGGSDLLTGKAGNDIIDGDSWLNVRIGIADATGTIVASAEHMRSQVTDVDGNVLYGGKTLDQLVLARTLNPGQFSIIREVVDGNQAGDSDTVVYRDVREAYSFLMNDDGSVTVTHNGVLTTAVTNDPLAIGESEGIDRLFNIEKLQFSDGAGGTVTYDLFDIVPVAATGAPAIVGTVQEGSTLTVDMTGIIDPNGILNPTFQWQASADNGLTWIDIAGATADSFVPSQAEVGLPIRVQAFWSDRTGTFETLASAASAPVADLPEPATGAPVISDVTPMNAQVLSVDTSTIADPNGVGTFSYQWESTDDGITWLPIAGANAAEFTPGDAEIGSQLRVVVSFTDQTTGTLEVLTSQPTFAVVLGPVAATGQPTISDTTPIEGSVLTADLAQVVDPNGILDPAYQWQASTDGQTWTDIAGATGIEFTPGQAQVGSMVRVSVSWTDGAETFEQVVSNATAAVADLPEPATGAAVISDVTPSVGQALTIDTASIADPNGVGQLSHQWQVSTDGTNWTNIDGATGTSFTPPASMLGAQLRVVTSFNDLTTGTLETVISTATSALTEAAVPATGQPTISDMTPTETQAITASSLGIADANGVGTISYQWQSSANNGATWTDIAGATAASFTPAQGQVGRILRVVASFTDGIGTAESLASQPTAVVGDSYTGTIPLLQTTFNGTEGDDIANGVDVTAFLGGSDTMNGRGGNDVLNGRNGNDTMTGGAGDDTLTGGTGTDRADYVGAVTNFTIARNGGSIIVTDTTGAEGSDTLNSIEVLRFNAVNHSVVNGTAAADPQNGTAGADVVFGLGGNDSINGQGGNDLIYGGAGDDFITQASSTGGRDFIDGEAGVDTYTIQNDTTTAETFVIYTRAAALAANPALVLHPTTEIVVTRNGAVMAELDNIEEIVVSTLRVTSPGGAAGGSVSGDTIQVIGDFNQTSLDFNTITIDGTPANDVVDISALTSAHRIVFTSNGGQDTVVGTLRPQDVVNMAVDGAPVANALPLADAAPVADVIPVIDAAPVIDQAPVSAPPVDPAPVAPVAAPAPIVDTAPVVEVAPAAAAAPVDQVLSGGSAEDTLTGGDGDDQMNSGSANDVLYGEGGDDLLSGGSGSDALFGGTGDDRLLGGSGEDYLDGGDGDDLLTGGTGADLFVFGNGDTISDFMPGEDMIDLTALGVTEENFAAMVTISAVPGGSRIRIGAQSMVLSDVAPGEITSASFRLAIDLGVIDPVPAPVVDTTPAPAEVTPAPVVDPVPAPVVDAAPAPAEVTPAPVVDPAPAPVADATPAPAEVTPAPIIDPVPAPVEDISGGQGADDPEGDDRGGLRLRGSRGSDDLAGSEGHDVLRGESGHDRIDGDAGNDVLMGGKGWDLLIGGEGDDLLFGGSGSDTLDGGQGSDALHGGKGSDTFVFGDGDVILDFEDDDDLIDLRGLGVTSENFDELVSIEEDDMGLTITIGDAVMSVLGEEELSMEDFRLEDDDASAAMAYGSDDLAWADMGRQFGPSGEAMIEEAMYQRMHQNADVTL